MLNFVSIYYFNLDLSAAMTTYHVHVITGTEFGSGTNANVFVKLYGDKDHTGMFPGNLFPIHYWRLKKIMTNHTTPVCFSLEKKNMNQTKMQSTFYRQDSAKVIPDVFWQVWGRTWWWVCVRSCEHWRTGKDCVSIQNAWSKGQSNLEYIYMNIFMRWISFFFKMYKLFENLILFDLA